MFESKKLKDRISKEEFCKYLELRREREKSYQDFYNITNGALDLNEYVDYELKPYKILERNFFTEEELDLIFWYLYENVDKKYYDSDEHTVIYEFNTDEDVWNYLNGVPWKKDNM